ncbi:MAG TPA: phosphoribosylamine--glycine ligase [Spirochaetia bacterium]|nr:phosphoribosylamine--glycine ligase [Spirochaetia bacterium]
MKVLVLGSGGREHALAWKLASSAAVSRVFVGPGNAGTAQHAANLRSVRPMTFETISEACRDHAIDCVFVGPEAPLAEGVVDFLASHRIPAIGPTRKAAQLESSKAFSKAFLQRNGLPTAAAETFEDPYTFERWVRARKGRRLVVKKSGLAAGKGVFESDDTEELIAFGAPVLQDDQLLVEEFLEGWEVSIFGLSDGKDFVVLPPCTDFKKAHEDDTGPNTGGMGSICPVPWVDAALMRTIRDRVVEPTYEALRRDGLCYTGVLYFGLMITSEGPKVLEFNVRFGDPETQVLLPMLNADLGGILEAMVSRSLSRLPAPPASGGSALGVVVASRGYPDASEPNAVVTAVPAAREGASVVFHASTVLGDDGKVRTGGGRCFTAVGLGTDLAQAAERAYGAAGGVRFDGAWYRADIGRKFMA